MGKVVKKVKKAVKSVAGTVAGAATLGILNKPKAPHMEKVKPMDFVDKGLEVDERRKRLALIRSGATQNSFSFLVNNSNSAKKTLLGG